MKYLFILIGALTLTSCTKEVVTPKANTSEYKLIEEGKYKKGIHYRIYDLESYNSSVLVEVYNSRDKIEVIVQATDDLSAWEFHPIEDIETWCWDCIGDCINETVGGLLQEEPAVTFVGAALCPECAAAFVGGVMVGCLGAEIEASL